LARLAAPQTRAAALQFVGALAAARSTDRQLPLVEPAVEDRQLRRGVLALTAIDDAAWDEDLRVRVLCRDAEGASRSQPEDPDVGELDGIGPEPVGGKATQRPSGPPTGGQHDVEAILRSRGLGRNTTFIWWGTHGHDHESGLTSTICQAIFRGLSSPVLVICC
jgi:hypothetical protein